MKRTLNTNEMVQELMQDDNANWTYEGATAMIEYFEALEADTWMSEEIEFNVVDIRCEFSEYRSLYKWADEHYAGDKWMEELGLGYDNEDENEQTKAIRSHLEENTTVIEFEGGVIIQDF